MKVFLNPGHAPDGMPDPGACGYGIRECDVAKSVAELVEHYLNDAGVTVVGNLQSDSLYEITSTANNIEPDLFISIHCNSFNSAAHGTETWHYYSSHRGKLLAECIQRQIVDSLGTTDRGIKECVPGTETNFYVVRETDAVAVLVELAFIDNKGDNELLRDAQDEFARAIARGVTDYEQKYC